MSSIKSERSIPRSSWIRIKHQDLVQVPCYQSRIKFGVGSQRKCAIFLDPQRRIQIFATENATLLHFVSGSLWLSLTLSLALSLARSLALWLSLWVSGSLAIWTSLWLSLALSGSIWLTRPLLGSQRRCCVVILYPTLHAIRIQISGSGYQYPVINSHQYNMKICIPHRIHACKRCYAHFKVHASSKYVH